MKRSDWKLFWVGYQPSKPVDEMTADELQATALLMAAHRPLVPMMLVALSIGLSPFMMQWALGGEVVMAQALETLPGGAWIAAHFHHITLFLAITSMLTVLPFAFERHKVRKYLAARGVEF